MAEVNMYRAREIYYDIVGTLNAMGWRFDRLDDKLAIKTGVKSQDLPIEFIMMVDANHQLVLLKSFLPIVVPENKLFDMAFAVCLVNGRLANGNFDFDFETRKISFRLCNSYMDSTVGQEVYRYMIGVSTHTIDDYNEKFYLLSTGKMSMDQFITLVLNR